MFLWNSSEDKLQEECGVFDWGHPEASTITALIAPSNIVGKKRQVLSATTVNISTQRETRPCGG